ncbi:MAG: DNA-directed RNA polymerase subunit beta, partial [Planctomycetota bacterium]
EGKIAVDDVVYPAGSDRGGEIIVQAGEKISKNAAEIICTAGVKGLEVMSPTKNPIIFNSLAEDNSSSHQEALLRIYQRLRPGNPAALEKAKALFDEKFYDPNRYRLGRVGRFRINRKLGLNVSETEMCLRPEDILESIKYLLDLTTTGGEARIDDIDHLGNRRLRTIDELASDELRKG